MARVVWGREMLLLLGTGKRKLQGVVAVAVQRRPAMGDYELPARARGRSGQGRAGARQARLRPGQQREWPAGLRKK
jgi:hypothetical protein